ncbi:MAG: hypothetical protein IJ565_03750 [Bacilli bacterium]|nr:hypothetical protein [Bacilli bacterium]
MVLRKPYAFLIKHFKLIHVIITALMVYVMSKTFNIMSVYDEYFTSELVLLGPNVPTAAFPGMLFFVTLLIMALCVLLFWIMLIKKKPNKLYVIIFVIYFYVLVMFLLGKSQFTSMVINVLNMRTIKLVRDLITISFLAQTFPLIKCLVRAVGFDIKQFDFGKDLEELEIEEKDNEEFEVNVNVDTNKMKRGFNFRTRNLSYIYKEHKFLINVGIGILAALIIIIIILGAIFGGGTRKKMNQAFTVNGLTFKMTDAYATRLSYNGNTLTGLNDNMTVVVIPFEVKNNTEKNTNLVTANVELSIGNHKFRNINTYRDGVYDLGTIYDSEEILAGTTQNKALAFTIPNNFVKRKMKLRFITSIGIKGKDLIPSYITIPIKPVRLDNVASPVTINSGEDINLSDTVLKNSTLNITKAEIAKRFKINYNYTIGKETIASYEYIYAPLETTADRILLKITGTATLDEKSNLNTLYDIINSYGVLEYTIGDKTKTVTNLPRVSPSYTNSSKTLYIAIPGEMETATNIKLILTIRNKQYEYIIK